MLQGAIVNDTSFKSISAVKPKREGGHARAKKAQGGHNVIWKRITKSFDEDLRKFGANPAMVAPISRWVLFKHLTPAQGMAARRYVDIVGKYLKFFSEGGAPTPRSANLEPTRKGEEDVIRRELMNGTLADYEADAKYAKRQYKRLSKVLARYADPITGRNLAKDHLDMLCMAEQEPPANTRDDIAAVLSAIADEFGLGSRKGKVQGFSAAPTQHKKGFRK